VRPYALADLQADLVARTGLFDRDAIALEALDALVEVGRVSAHVDRVADAQAPLQHDDAGPDVVEVVRDDPDLARLRCCDRARR
jgi:hypothetical protein